MNTLKDRLKSGQTAVGTSALANSDVNFLGDTDYDFIFFDKR